MKKREEHLDIIIDEVDRLTILTNDILDMTKEEANVDFLKIERFNLAKEIKKLLISMKLLKKQKNIILF